MTGRQRMTIAWVVFIAAAVVVFAVLETYALMHADSITLSRFVVEVSRAWPPLIFLSGYLAGLLTSHFWWPWNPNDPNDHRG